MVYCIILYPIRVESAIKLLLKFFPFPIRKRLTPCLFQTQYIHTSVFCCILLPLRCLIFLSLLYIVNSEPREMKAIALKKSEGDEERLNKRHLSKINIASPSKYLENCKIMLSPISNCSGGGVNTIFGKFV